MAKVRVFEAATEGFRLIRREPKAVLAWSGVLFLILGLPVVLLMQAMAPTLVELSQAGADGSGEGPWAMQALILSVAPLIGVLAVLAYVVIGGAVLRAVIAPDDRRFFYMRLGKSEVWLVVSAIVGFILFYIALVLIVLALAVVIAIPFALMTGGEADFSGVHWGIVLGVIAGYVVGIYLMLRFSMAPTMSFDQKRFRLFESWGFTRGNGWRLFGLVLVIWLAVLLVELALGLVFFAGLAPTLLTIGDDPMAAVEFERQIFAFYASPMMWPAAIVGGLLGGAYMALMFAPWARVYRMLKDEYLPAIADAAEPAPDPAI